MDDHVCTPPQQILGFTIRSHTRIYVSYLIPNILHLFLYIGQFVGDCAVVFEHFDNQQPSFAWATLSLILIPPVLSFVILLNSESHWSNPQYPNKCYFFIYQIIQLLLFPFFSIYRFSLHIFWSIEAFFHDDDDKERMLCLEKAAQTSTCELYHLIQAYGQSAPQIILQLYHILTQDMFRNYQTNVATITAAYQRFESQRQVGRNYPWSPPQDVTARRSLLEKNQQLLEECERRKRESERTIASFPESDVIMANFKQHQSRESLTSLESGRPSSLPPLDLTVQVHSSYDETDKKDTTTNRPQETKALHIIKEEEEQQSLNINAIEVLDEVPETPPPPPLPKLNTSALSNTINFTDPIQSPETPLLRPQQADQGFDTRSSARFKRSSRSRSQFETFADMLIVDAQLYIKRHVPRPPKILINKLEPEKPEEPNSRFSASMKVAGSPPASPQDVVDFFLPRPTRIVNGIQQDDFAGKTIAFFGWLCFVIMRVLSLGAFCAFYPQAFFILIGCHYTIMLLALWLESRLKEKLNRTLFYFLLAYVYIFVIIEFRVHFKHLKVWFIGYFLLIMSENITMTAIWYRGEEMDSWWFNFIYESILYSGILFILSLVTYYWILKPKDVVLLIEDQPQANKTNSS